MDRLASPLETLKTRYKVVVIGSGYGGSISACRLARAGQTVCVLERGKEFVPGEFPDTLAKAGGELHVDAPGAEVGERNGLYDFHVNEDINVFKGCGLGGTSLVNASVSLEVDPRVFDDVRWPRKLREDKTLLETCYRRAEEMLGATAYPESAPKTRKLASLEKSARAMHERFYRPKINVSFEAGTNAAGIEHGACVLCGDCLTGCNYGAKNSTRMNYLPDACRHGAEIFTEIDVRYIGRVEEGWAVYFCPLGKGREKFDAPLMSVRADIVMLAGGTLGSTEILLRSRKKGLPLSDRVGDHFGGNGDVLGFGYDTEASVNGVGFGHHPPTRREAVGPCISGVIDMRDCEQLDDGMVIEEGSIPGALAPMLAVAFAGGDALGIAGGNAGVPDPRRLAHLTESLVQGASHGAVGRSQTYLVMAHDDHDGRMVLEDDRLRVRWPGVGARPVFRRINDRLREVTDKVGGHYVSNPIWSPLLRHHMVTVHPLGGCIMAESAESGVVNHACEVFSRASGDSVHAGLFVCDASVIPRSLGVNPLLTISAIAERACLLLASRQGWTIDYGLARPITKKQAKTPTAVEFTEKMAGWFSSSVLDDFRSGADAGKMDGSPFEFVLTIAPDDLEAMMNEPGYEARAVGTVRARTLSIDPLTVEEGRFQLFVDNPNEADVREMHYRFKLAAKSGRCWFFHGFKVIKNAHTAKIWHDTSTLYITLFEGSDEKGTVVGKGILSIAPGDFARQLTTMKILHAPSRAAELDAMSRFGQFFAGPLLEDYGGIFARGSVLDPHAPPRRRRALRAPAPEIYPFDTQDGVELRLTRYPGGSRGPVVLVHGMGASSRLFNIDTIDTNLVEYLVDKKYDVWLFDWRGSILLNASQGEFDCDEVARYDHPLAAQKLIELTGKKEFDWLVHCVGSMSFFMSMLMGRPRGVRSVLACQVAAHPIAPAMNRIKSDLHLPALLRVLGLTSLDAATYVDSPVRDRIFNEALKSFPLPEDEKCHSTVCHRISFLYSLCYRHTQINRHTHAAVHEMFGIANMKMMSHLATCTRAGKVVSANGDDSYISDANLDRLRLPITFIVGAMNRVWKPEATGATYDLLRKKHGDRLYKRHVVPEYGHLDPIFGKHAARDVYPLILEHFEHFQN